MSSRRNDPTKHTHDPIDRDCAFVLRNIEAFSLNALDSFERSIVEHHLRWCETCRAEAEAFERVVQQLPFASLSAMEPSPGVKSGLLSRLTDIDDRVPSSAPQDSDAPSVPVSSATSSWLRFASAALIAPLALALLVVGVWASSLRTDLNERDLEYESQVQLNQALASGGQVELYSVEQSCKGCEGSGQLGVSPSNGMGMMVGWNFDPSQQHDVWGVNIQGERKKVCRLQVDASGAVMQMFNFPEATSLITDVYITDETGQLIYVSHLAGQPGDDQLPFTPSA